MAHYTIGISDSESHPCGGRVLKAMANETFMDFGPTVSKNILETLLSVTGQWPCHPRVENCWIFVTVSTIGKYGRLGISVWRKGLESDGQ